MIWMLCDEAARRHGVRIIAVDRPGFGGSDPRPGRSVLDWAADVEQVADQLHLGRFGVVAISGGGAYAAATAWKHPDRVTVLGLFSVIGPLDRPGALAGTNRPVRLAYGMARRTPWLLRQFVRLLARDATRNPERAISRIERTRPPEDRAVVARPEVRRVLLANLPNQFRDPDTVVHEFRLAVRPWGFPLADIVVPTHLWQGERDDVHTPAMAQFLARAIPGAELSLEPTFATFTYLDHLDPIFEVLARAAEGG
jgi:pimeloyl-ACP methyl ester carboxylesterase